MSAAPPRMRRAPPLHCPVATWLPAWWALYQLAVVARAHVSVPVAAATDWASAAGVGAYAVCVWLVLTERVVGRASRYALATWGVFVAAFAMASATTDAAPVQAPATRAFLYLVAPLSHVAWACARTPAGAARRLAALP